MVGPQIRKCRYKLGLTQEQLAARFQLRGFDVSRGTLSQIEAQVRCVKDFELFKIASILKIPIEGLFTSDLRKRRRVAK